MDQRSMVAHRIDTFYYFAARCGTMHFYALRFFRVRRLAFRWALVGRQPPNDFPFPLTTGPSRGVLTGVPRAAAPDLADAAAADADGPRVDGATDCAADADCPRADSAADANGATDADNGLTPTIGADGSGNDATACATTIREFGGRRTPLPSFTRFKADEMVCAYRELTFFAFGRTLTFAGPCSNLCVSCETVDESGITHVNCVAPYFAMLSVNSIVPIVVIALWAISF